MKRPMGTWSVDTLEFSPRFDEQALDRDFEVEKKWDSKVSLTLVGLKS